MTAVDGFAEMLAAFGAGNSGLYQYLTDEEFRNAERDRLRAELGDWPELRVHMAEDQAALLADCGKVSYAESVGWHESTRALGDKEFCAALKSRQPGDGVSAGS
jgi:hypothetical protein